jgi:protein-S-isoprenylcysteine O-methyltransferase Ste14
MQSSDDRLSRALLMPPGWLPLAILGFTIVISALRVWGVKRVHGVQAFGFGRHAAIQGVAQRSWKIAAAATLALAAIAWLAPDWEAALGRPNWAGSATLRWISAILFVGSAAIIVVAQQQMGASWRIGVPAEGPGALVTRGLFAWSRNPIFVGLLSAVLALFLSSPTLPSAAILAATWTLAVVQVRIEEDALRERHGDEYERYAARVRRWLGRRSP